MSALKYGHPKYWAKREAGQAAHETPGFLAWGMVAAAAFVLLLIGAAWCLSATVAWALVTASGAARGALRPKLTIPFRRSDARFVPTLLLTVVIVVGGLAFLATRPKGDGQASVDRASITVARRPASNVAVAAKDRAALLPGTGVPASDVSERCRYQSASGGDYSLISYACVTNIVDPKTGRRGVFHSTVACDVPAPSAPTVQVRDCITGGADQQLEEWQVAGEGQS